VGKGGFGRADAGQSTTRQLLLNKGPPPVANSLPGAVAVIVGQQCPDNVLDVDSSPGITLTISFDTRTHRLARPGHHPERGRLQFLVVYLYAPSKVFSAVMGF